MEEAKALYDEAYDALWENEAGERFELDCIGEQMGQERINLLMQFEEACKREKN